jgi:hypothetical protein
MIEKFKSKDSIQQSQIETNHQINSNLLEPVSLKTENEIILNSNNFIHPVAPSVKRYSGFQRKSNIKHVDNSTTSTIENNIEGKKEFLIIEQTHQISTKEEFISVPQVIESIGENTEKSFDSVYVTPIKKKIPATFSPTPPPTKQMIPITPSGVEAAFPSFLGLYDEKKDSFLFNNNIFDSTYRKTSSVYNNTSKIALTTPSPLLQRRKKSAITC